MHINICQISFVGSVSCLTLHKKQWLPMYCLLFFISSVWAVPPTKGKGCLHKQCSSRRHFKNLCSIVAFIIIIRRTWRIIGKKNWKEELEETIFWLFGHFIWIIGCQVFKSVNISKWEVHKQIGDKYSIISNSLIQSQHHL